MVGGFGFSLEADLFMFYVGSCWFFIFKSGLASFVVGSSIFDTDHQYLRWSINFKRCFINFDLGPSFFSVGSSI
jgi:hypothetical protein